MSAAPSIAASARARRLFARLAGAAAVLTFVVIVASAFMRHTQAGLGCIDWPDCYGRIAAVPAAPTIGVHLARTLHRLAASAALLLIVAMLLTSRGAPALRVERILALAALAVALLLAALGLFTPGADLPAVPVGNLLGGFLMLALLAAQAGSAAGIGQCASPPLRWLALALVAALFAQACVGALIGTQFALRSCPGLAHCADAAGAAPSPVVALNPLERLPIVDGHVVPPPGATGLHVVHRTLGLAIAVTALALAWTTRTWHRSGAIVLGVLALLTPLLGAAALLDMPSLPLTVLHNAAAAAMIATLAGIAAMREATRRQNDTGPRRPIA